MMTDRFSFGALLVCTIVTLSCFIGVPSARADGTLRQISAQIEQYAVVRADFEQTKQMAALKRPLVTKGRLVVSGSRGVLWQIEQPFHMSYVLGESKIVEIGSDGARRVRDTREVPGLAQVGRVFRAMLGADSDALREYFEATVQGTPDHWAIELTPKQAQLAKFLGAMQLSGGRFVEEIRISEAGGDRTQIAFQNSRGASTLSADELALFGGDDLLRSGAGN